MWIFDVEQYVWVTGTSGSVSERTTQGNGKCSPGQGKSTESV